MFAGVSIDFSRRGTQLALLAALLVALALAVGYATADGGYQGTNSIAPAPLTKVRAETTDGEDIRFSKLTVTSRLQPASRRAAAPPASQRQTPAVQQTPSVQQQPAPVVRQPQPQTPTPRQPSTGGSNSFDSSG